MEQRAQTIAYDLESERAHERVPEPIDSLEGSAAPDRLLDVASVLWLKRKLIGKIALRTAVITLIFSLFIPNTYRSTTQLMPPDDQSSGKSTLAMMAGMASKVGGAVGGSDMGALAGDLLGTHSSGDLFLGVLRSRTAENNLVQQFDLTAVYGIPWLHIRAQKDDARKQLELNTEMAQDRKSGIITISTTDRDPQRAAALANGYAEQLNHLLASLSTSSAGRERQFLEQRLVEVKKDLDDATAQLGQFSSKNTTFDPLVQGKATVDAVATLEGELIATQSQLSGLQALYTPENARVRSLQARVTELKKQLSALSGNADITSLNTSDESSSMAFPSLRQLPLLSVKYADLFRRAKIEETVYQVLTQQYEMAKVQEAKEIPTVRALDRGEVPLRKWGPHRGILVILGFVVGVLFGCMAVIGVDRWRRWNRTDPRKVFLVGVFRTIINNRFVHAATARVSSLGNRLHFKSLRVE